MSRLEVNAGEWAATEARPHTDQVLLCQQPCNAERFYDKVFAQYVDRLALIEARAGPNQRLVKTFGIDNAFTTIDPEYHEIFVNRVVAQLKTIEWEWSAMSTLAVGFVRDDLAQGDLETGILLVPLVQKVVLKIVLLKFFPQEAQLEDDAAIATVAECIKSTLDRTPNEQWCY